VNPVRTSLIVLLCSLCLAACGFRLAGSPGQPDSRQIPAQLTSIYLVTNNFSEVQRKALEQSLSGAGVALVEQADDTAARLTVTLNEPSDQQLATGGSGGDVVKRITRSLDYNVKAADGTLIAPQSSLRRHRDVTLDENSLLAANREKKAVTLELEQALYDQLIRQLARIKTGA